jgi:hypothetical protein
MKNSRAGSQSTVKPVATPPVTIIILNVPKELQPILAASCAHWEQSPEHYTLAALLASLECDVEIIHATAKEIMKKWRNK